jgi:prepilin-type N-terminal cleavage/methylation domain-containing protein
MKQSKGGFTLIETIIAIILLGIVALGLASFIFTSMEAWVLISGRDAAVSRARVAMNRMIAELRRVRKPQNLLTTTTSECRFIDLDAEQVDFQQSGSDLLRNSDILAAGLDTPTGLRFTYLDATGEVTATQLNMRSIRVWLSLSAGNQRTTLESSARIRNL